MTDKEEILGAIQSLRGEMENRLTHVEKDITELRGEVKAQSERFTYFQQATQSLVNLAFSLIASATVITIASAIFKR